MVGIASLSWVDLFHDTKSNDYTLGFNDARYMYKLCLPFHAMKKLMVMMMMMMMMNCFCGMVV